MQKIKYFVIPLINEIVYLQCKLWFHLHKYSFHFWIYIHALFDKQ